MWNLYDSALFDGALQKTCMRGMKVFLDTKGRHTLAAQLSNRTIIHIDLLEQIYSQQKKEDLQAKIDEFKVVEKETLRREKI